MAGFSDYLENKLIDFLFRGQSFANPVIYVGLLTAAPTDSSAGTEVSGGAYARVKAAAGSTQALTDWKSTQGTDAASTGTGGQTSNSAIVAFPSPTAAWGAVTHFGIYDAASGGSLLFFGTLTAQKTVNSGDAAPTFAVGALTVTLD